MRNRPVSPGTERPFAVLYLYRGQLLRSRCRTRREIQMKQRVILTSRDTDVIVMIA